LGAKRTVLLEGVAAVIERPELDVAVPFSWLYERLHDTAATPPFV
jgi:hypothetical protein